MRKIRTLVKYIGIIILYGPIRVLSNPVKQLNIIYQVKAKYLFKIFNLVIVLSCFSLLSLLSIWSSPSEDLSLQKPNIILFSIDTLRADHLSCYGYGRETSRYIDEFLKDSVFFKKAYS